MAELWRDDLAALGERSQHHLRSPAATRAALLATPQETKMRFFKNPVLAALIVLAVIALAAPIAYAVVGRVFLSIDADKSAPEIEQDLNRQLQSQGVPATVEAHKSDDGIVHVKIESDQPDLPAKLEVGTPNADEARAYRVEVVCPGETHCDQLHDAATNQDILNVLVNAGSMTDEELAARIQEHLEAYDVDVTVENQVVTIRCRSR